MTEQEKSTALRNIEQRRGEQAWLNISEIKSRKNESLEKEYRSFVRGLNAMIQINGLGQTLGFMAAKGKNDPAKPHSLVLKHLTQWMKKNFQTSNSDVLQEVGLIRWITDKDTSSATYRRATTECLAFGMWLRRFAEAELKEPDSNTNAASGEGV